QVVKAAEEAGKKIAVAVEVENDGMTGLRRHVPDDDLLAVISVEDVLFGFGKARLLRRGARYGRNRKQEGALRQEQRDEPPGITDRNDNQQPFQDGHRSVRGVSLHRLDDALGNLLGVAEQ